MRPAALLLGLCLAAALPQHLAAQDEAFNPGPGVAYIIKNVDSTGAFASRGAITFHADHTLSVTDSGQGGPVYFFSSQLGTWGVNRAGLVVGRTVDFDFTPDNDVARLDYKFKFGKDGSISGTISLSYFPQTANPFGPGGAPGGTFTFTGYAIPLPE
jgi:hypothetical protein